jgi:hypothetical protein
MLALPVDANHLVSGSIEGVRSSETGRKFLVSSWS